LVFEELCYGTIDGATVPPRVVAQRALRHNAAALIVAHNHPSGAPRKRTCVMQQMLPE
jgi:DNA repair protein RadC